MAILGFERQGDSADGKSPTPYAPSSFDAHHLAEGVSDFDEVALGRHDGVDGLVSSGSFVDHLGVLAAFHTFGHALVVFDGEAPPGFTARHGAAGTVAATHEAFGIALAANDVGARAHAAGND